MMSASYAVLVALALLASSVCASHIPPYVADGLRAGINGANQVHLALGGEQDEITVTWLTPEPASSRARYGLAASFPDIAIEVEGYAKVFVDNGTLHHTQYVHRATFASLKERARYSYQVWNGTEWGRLFGFTAPGGVSWNPTITVYGDFGLSNPRSFPALLDELSEGKSDFIVHSGDFAYDMFRDNATYGDNWFNFVEPLYAQIPVMTCAGNHEGMYDFLNYRSRFTMPMYEKTENLYFSFNAGNTHWISYDTEVYFVYEAMEGHGGIHRNFGPYPDIAAAQLKFIEEDLIRANKERHLRPWIFAYGHRPFYCSDSDDDDCTRMQDQWRVDLEKLFYTYGVDIVFEAHQHSYERLWPTYLGNVYNHTDGDGPYVNPLAPIHIVAGAAGCEEMLQPFQNGPLGPWSAVRISDYGYGHVTIHNATHAHWEQLSADKVVQDEIWIVRDKHVDYALV
eukprot:Opistho-2@41675